MPNRQIVNGEPYRYAYQGQEKDPETGKEAFQLRLWDSRIGRWLTPDPAAQYYSPYLGMGNNPISRIDPDGGTDCPPGEICGGGHTNQLDGFCLGCPEETPLYSTEVERYSFNGTLDQYKQTYNVSGTYEEIKANWEKNHSKDFNAWTNQMDQAQKDAENLGKLSLFTSYFVATEDVINVMPINVAANVTTKIISKTARSFKYNSLIPENHIYRAVDDIELAILKKEGKFTLQSGGLESKYFAKTLQDANWYGMKLYPKGYTIVKGVYKGNISSHWFPNVDIGAYNFSSKYLPFIKY